jgi:hypothetical protein
MPLERSGGLVFCTEYVEFSENMGSLPLALKESGAQLENGLGDL